MGGAVAGAENSVNKSLSSIPVIGTALTNFNKYSPFTGLGTVAADIDRSVQDPGGAKNTASNALTAQNDASTRQQAQAAQLQQTLLTQPKNISPDNFLASKTAQLAGLKLGLASTITGGGNTSGVLSYPSLSGTGPGKLKLGQ